MKKTLHLKTITPPGKVLTLVLLMVFSLNGFQAQSEDYYWVGGQGAWSDLNSWQTSNGQIPNEVPDPTDNVIFNENSFENPFDTVYIYTGNPTCNNFIVENLTDTVVFVGGSTTTTFSVYGSWTMHEKVRNYYKGKIKFLSEEPGNTITCAGTPFAGDIWFESGGEWILQDTLLVIDTVPWELIVIYDTDPFGPNPGIIHVRGRLDANEQTIISRGFSTTGDMDREFDFENSHAYVNGNWDLAGTGLTFNGSNSYILLGGIMNNFSGAGQEIYYHDIDVKWPDALIRNTDIRTHMRKVHYLGGGALKGIKNEGLLGMFTIDTLIMEGALTALGEIGNTIDADYSNIHYTLFKLTWGSYEGSHGVFHRLDDSCSYGDGNFEGIDNTIDSIHFFIPKKAYILGENTINNLAYFRHVGVVDAYPALSNYADHMVINGDGWILGSNTINHLTLNSGYWYRFSADSLGHPGSIPTQTNLQTIGQIEVEGSCEGGFTFLSSDSKETMAYINFLDSGFETEYLAVKDVHNLGQSMVLSNSIDLGNNEGLEFINSPDPRTLYWVGGDGNWGSTQHWSLESGGEGGECPPTPLDDVYFDAGSGFLDSSNVNVNINYACARDFIWEEVDNLPSISSDTNNLRIWGSFITNPSMQFLVRGNVYLESEDDEEYESVVIDYTLKSDSTVFSSMHQFYGQVHFWGRGGKWQLDSKYENYYDTTHLIIGELLLENDTMSMWSFSATDTLQKGMYMLDKTLITVHAFGNNAWHFNAYKYDKENPAISKTWWDQGLSTIRAVGNITPPPGMAAGRCNILTIGGHLDYHNIEFGDTNMIYASTIPGTYTTGIESRLISAAKCTYNLVDFYISRGSVEGWAEIDTLTFNRKTQVDGSILSADHCRVRNEHFVNFLYAEGIYDSLIMSGGRIDTAFFYNEGGMWGWHDVGYLEAHEKFKIDLFNKVDTALLMGDAEILGLSEFSQLVLWPNHKYIFQHDREGLNDTTTIRNDWIIMGDCDAPIRLQSDSIGTQAKINYLAENPTYLENSADYASIKDIWMLGDETHYAINSVDLGNNTNWEFVESGNEIFYWVGGQGRWGDWTHWALESGGEPVSEKCTPRENNTVVFDDNSFNAPYDTVYVDVSNAYCLNMYWKHSPELFKPVFTGTDSTSLYVYGSLLLNDSMDFQYEGFTYFDELNLPNEPDTLTSRGHRFLNDVRFQGINDVVVLEDRFELKSDVIDPKKIFLEHGEIRTHGNDIKADGFYSIFKNPRTLNITDSKVYLGIQFKRSWWVDGENLEFISDNSCIYDTAHLSTFITLNGEYLKFHDVMLMGMLDSLYNEGNTCEYNNVGIYGASSMLHGNYIADSILLRGNSAGMFGESQTNYVVIDSMYGSINDNHNINKCIVNKFGLIRGESDFDLCIFFDDGVFMGPNEFDTLMLFPGDGNLQNLGNWFYFESNETQTVYDSLYLRGNQCSNITIVSLDAPALAWIKKDDGEFDVSCDYLNIMSVGAESANLTFYAGSNSTALPVPEDPPPGWVFENSQGYIYGFDGQTEEFCDGESYIIHTNSFNGDPNTQYYWDNNPEPGDPTYEVTAEGTYQVKVEYNEGCYVEDSLVVILNLPPDAVLEQGPFCEGEDIIVYCVPDHDSFLFEWWNGETTAMIVADLSYTGEISLTVTDPLNSCKTELSQSIVVNPVPHPQPYLGVEAWIKFEEFITLDAGPGESWEWSSDPEVPIQNPDQQMITVTGFGDPNPVNYSVVVTQNGCTGAANKIVGMYPPSKLGVPTAFSPNGDGDNDELKVMGTGFDKLDFRIYNRFGELVFETNDPNIGWDGNVDGTKQEIEVYTYYIHVVFEDKSEAEEKGNITVLR